MAPYHEIVLGPFSSPCVNLLLSCYMWESCTERSIHSSRFSLSSFIHEICFSHMNFKEKELHEVDVN